MGMEKLSNKGIHKITRFMIANETFCRKDYKCLLNCFYFCLWYSESKQLQNFFAAIVSTSLLETSFKISSLFVVEFFKSLHMKWPYFNSTQSNKFSMITRSLIIHILETVYRGSGSTEMMTPSIAILIECVISKFCNSYQDSWMSLNCYLCDIFFVEVKHLFSISVKFPPMDEFFYFLQPVVQMFLLKKKFLSLRFRYDKSINEKLTFLFIHA